MKVTMLDCRQSRALGGAARITGLLGHFPWPQASFPCPGNSIDKDPYVDKAVAGGIFEWHLPAQR